jgi:hypothetical protein
MPLPSCNDSQKENCTHTRDEVISAGKTSMLMLILIPLGPEIRPRSRPLRINQSIYSSDMWFRRFHLQQEADLREAYIVYTLGLSMLPRRVQSGDFRAVPLRPKPP